MDVIGYAVLCMIGWHPTGSSYKVWLTIIEGAVTGKHFYMKIHLIYLFIYLFI